MLFFEIGICICRTQPCENKFTSNYINIRVASIFSKNVYCLLPDLCPLSIYTFVHVCTILTIGRSIIMYMQGFPRSKHMIVCNAIFPHMNIQDRAKSLLIPVLQSIPVVANPFRLAFCILMVMEYGVLQQSRFVSEGMLEDYAVSVLLQRE